MMDKIGVSNRRISYFNVKGDSNAKKVETYMEAIDQVLSNEIIIDREESENRRSRQENIGIEHDLEEQNKAKMRVISKSKSLRSVAHELMKLSSFGIQDMNDSSVKTLLEKNDSKIVLENGLTYLILLNERVKLESSIPKFSSQLFSRAKELERGAGNIDKASEELKIKS